MFSLLLVGFVGYILGSVPAAYLVVRWKADLDIRRVGSGNVGTLNSFEVTRSRFVGVAVLLLDVGKGMLSAAWPVLFFGDGFEYMAASGACAVIGHNFPVWLRGKGGRGLAPAAGVMFVLGWLCVVIWGFLWAIGFALMRNVNMGNTIATVGLLVSVLISPSQWTDVIFTNQADPVDVRIFAFFLLTPIIIKLIDPVKEYFSQRQTSKDL